MYTLDFTIDDSSPLIYYVPQENAWSQKDPHNERSAPNYHSQTLTVTYTRNATASFLFNGTSLTITGGRRPGYGNFTVTIDGSIFELTADEATEQYKQTIFETHDLKQGLHHVRLTNTDTQGRGFDIDSVRTSKISSTQLHPRNINLIAGPIFILDHADVYDSGAHIVFLE
ncbi:hypothetical protein E1B28_006228 [Marasmius oreades]|uniref:Uncharacterized protein n=1 Tax=Marasmius oreades TaxID=181124 RepID=A0A9P7S4X6_9AGAR|nr:uncharacterized protein E1B28_006228 [Marasmius oreades]KAG7095489.1 hypothetical protein E1B28_006228 [Marasmius oreades]